MGCRLIGVSLRVAVENSQMASYRNAPKETAMSALTAYQYMRMMGYLFIRDGFLKSNAGKELPFPRGVPPN
jgi:hypothetical protein